jgi:hypothetical protein
MRAALSVVMVLAMGCFVMLGAQAADKEVTLKGKITCAKCELAVKDVKACATVIVTKEGGKDVVYYFDTESHKKNHKTICQEGKEGIVVGKVSEKEGKKTITASKVEFK